MNDLNIAMILRLVDRVSEPARKVRGALSGIAESATGAGNRATAFADRQLEALEAQRAAMQNSALETAAIGYGLYRAMQPAIEFESAMAGVRRVVTFDDETAIERLGEDILELTSSGGLPMAAEGVASIIEAAGQAGIIDDALPDEERRAKLIAFARDAAQMGVAFDMSAAQAGEAMAQWRGALGLTQERALGLGDAVNHISNSMNASAPDLVQVIRRQGAVAMTAGLAETEVAALSAAFLAGGASPEIAATALKNFTGALTRGEAMTARQRSVMEGLGFDATEMAERMQVDARGAITDVMTALSELPEARRGAALSQLFGEESMGAIAPLLNNLDLLRESFDLVADPSDFAGAMLEEYEQQASTTANAVARLRGFFVALSTTLGSALLPELNNLLEAVMPVVGVFRDWAEENPELVRQIGIATAGLFAMRLASLALRFAALTAAVPVLRLIGMGGRLVAFLPVLARGLLALLNPLALVRGAMIALRVAMLTSGIGAIIAGIALAGLWIWNNWEGLLAFFQGFGVGLRAALGPAAPLLDWLVERVRPLAEWIGALVAPLDASAEAWSEWGETAGGWLGGVVSQLVEWIETSPAVAKGVALVTAGVMGLRLALRIVTWPLRMFGRMLGGAVGGLARFNWGEYLSLDALSGYIEDIKEWFTWGNLLEVISWVTWLPIAPFTALMERIFGFEWSDFLPDWSWSFIGEIDFGGLITWPEPPAWLLWLMARDDSPIVEAPVVADMPGFDQLPPEVRQAAETVQAAAGRSALPAQRIAELREEAEAIRAEIAALEDQLTGPKGPGDMMASAERRRRLGQAQRELEALVQKIAEAEAQSDQLEAALALLSDTEAAPEINITSIERALERVRQLSDGLRNLPGGTANGVAPAGTTGGEPHPAGSRALGGSVRPGFGYRINEQGEEIFVPDVAGRVIPARAARMIMAASMAGVPAVAAAGAIDMPALASFNPAAIAAEMPNIDRSPSLVGAGGNQQVGGVTVGDIHIHAAPGMNPQDIAAEVRREIERIGRESGSANGLHDGGQYDRD